MPSKFSLGHIEGKENFLHKKKSIPIKMTPLKEITNMPRQDSNSADKAKGSGKMLSQVVLSSQKCSSNEDKDIGKVSYSAENP
jgi:hypothetical protein